ncbi:MAG: hypothetical protein IJ099_02115 [Alphaproteobacteria bacterium]|nr:hypothetical protein [Alphaproteobacteria bacterium]
MKEWAQMRVSGFLGFIHKLVMFITWPLRHWKFLLISLLIVAAIVIAVPLISGTKFVEIPSWYKAKMTHPFLTVLKNNVTNITQSTEQKINESVNSVKDKVEQIAPEIIKTEAEEENKKEKIRFTAWNVAKFNKTKYQQPKSKKQKITLKSPTFAELKEETASKQEKMAEPIINEDEQEAPTKPYYDGNLADYYTVRRDLDLIYLTESEKLYGQVDVVGANSLYINNTYIYLYGIYTNPNIYNEQAARLYLEKLIDNKAVHCDVVAYSVQSQTPTALCFIDGKLINQELVDAQYAANIALK